MVRLVIVRWLVDIEGRYPFQEDRGNRGLVEGQRVWCTMAKDNGYNESKDTETRWEKDGRGSTWNEENGQQVAV